MALLWAILPAQGGDPVQVLDGEKVAARLTQHVIEAGPWKPENVELRVVSFRPVSIPAGSVSYRILRPTTGIIPGPLSFLMAVDVAGKEEARFWVRTEIKIFDEVVVSSFPLANHELVNPNDVRVERRDISSLLVKPLHRTEEVIGRQTTRAIEINEILTQNSLERPTLIKRGSPIMIVYETGSLRIEI
ncbi:MAG TPA: flagellar basal body P-ring formation chaperone FlgA, partial [Candidatus Acidoferrales bacterium]|nr:flagellar basal body P-ring formation chaperone FlgA [Candidatus Acidoferrales bacterium]